MPTYIETCPLGLTDKEIAFTIDGDRQPSPTQECICGGTPQEQTLREFAGAATAHGLGRALGDSILSEGKPVEYRSYEVKCAHSSKIVKTGE